MDGMLLSQVESPKSLTAQENPPKEDQVTEGVTNAKGVPSQQTKKVAIVSIPTPSTSEENIMEEAEKESESEEIEEEKPSSANNRYKEMLAEVAVSEEDMKAGIPSSNSSRQRGWSAGVSFDAGMVSFAGLGASDLYYSNASDPGSSDDPNNSQTPPEEGEEKTSMPTRAKEVDLIDQLHNWRRKHYLPITVGLTAEKRLSSWLGIETGLAYSYLHSDYEGYMQNATCHWHYLEIPLKMNMYAYQSDRFSIYGSVGGRVAIPVYSNAAVHTMGNSSTYCITTLDPEPVWSAGVSLGFSYRLTKRLNLYLEPSLQYHFPQDAKVPNIWTDDEPWSFSIPIGVRFSW